MNPGLDKIHRKVSALRMREFWIRLFQGLSLAGAVWLCLWILGPLGLGILHGWSGLILRVLILFAAAGVIIMAITRAIYPRGTDDRLALRIEKVYPNLNNSLISSLQLTREREHPDPRHPFSAYLLERLLQNTASQMPAIDLSRVATLEGLKWRFLLFCLAVLSALVIHNLYPAYLGNGFQLLILSEFRLPEKSARERALLSAEPLTTGDFTLEYIYPAYSGLKPQEVQHTSGEISALAGTEVIIHTTCLERVASANLVVGGSARIPLRVDDGNKLSGKLVVMEPGEYLIEAEDSSRVQRREPESHPIRVEDDLYPEVVLKQPVSDLEVCADDFVQISWEAEDDFGIGGVSLVYQRGMEEERLEIFRSGERPDKRHEGDYDWDLTGAGVSPGDRVAFYLEVDDNDNISGPKKGRSATLYLDVFSAFKKHEEVIAKEEELFENMIEHLADHLDDERSRLDASPGYILEKAEAELIQRGRELLAHIQNILKMMESDIHTSELMKDSMENMGRVYKSLLEARSGLVRALVSSARPVKELVGLRREYIEDLERDIIFLDRMIKKQRMDLVLMEGKNLARAQEDLAELLERYKETHDPALLDELQRKMAELEAAFQELLSRMAMMRSEMGDEFFNIEAMDGPRWNDIFEQVARMRNALQDGDLDSAMAQAEDFLNSLGQMMAALNEQAGQYGEAISAEALRRMDEAIEKLAELEAGEQDMIERSEAIYHRQLEKTAQLESMLDRFIEDEAEKIEEIRRKLGNVQNEMRGLTPARKKPQTNTPDEIKQTTMEFYRKRNLFHHQIGGITRQLRERGRELEHRELEQVLEGMKKNQETMERIRDDMEVFMDRFQAEPDKKREQTSEQCQGALALGQEIIDDLEALRGTLKPAFAPGDTAEMKAMADEQEGIRDQTMDVWQEVADLEDDVPAIPMGVTGKLDQAALSMRDASGYLLLEEPGSALAPEREARLRLKQAREDLVRAQKQMSQMAQSGAGLPLALGGRRSGGGGTGTRGLAMKGFKLPEEGADKTPEEFRQNLLKAMREEAPEEYRHLNHDYYERLMR